MKTLATSLMIIAIAANSAFCQFKATDEEVFINYLKQQTNKINPIVSDDDFKYYCNAFDKRRYMNAKLNEFEFLDYYNEIMDKLKSKILNFSNEKKYVEPITIQLKEYDFNTETFDIKIITGSYYRKYNSPAEILIEPLWYNWKRDFGEIKINVGTEAAKLLLESTKDKNGKTTRITQIYATYTFMEKNIRFDESRQRSAFSYYLPIAQYYINIEKIDIYSSFSNGYGVNKVATIYPKKIDEENIQTENENVKNFEINEKEKVDTKKNVNEILAWNKYTDAKNLFVVEYPSNWDVKIGDQKVTLYSPLTEVSEYLRENIIISASRKEYSTKMSLSVLANKITKDFKKELLEFTEEGRKYMTWNGEDAVELSGTFIRIKDSKRQKVRFIQRICFHNGYQIMATFGSPAHSNKFDKTAQDVFDKTKF